jgi:hypothetical protein
MDLTVYPKSTSLINLENFLIDCLIDTKTNFKSILDMDMPNVGNIIMIYYSQATILRVIKSLLPIIEANADKVSK